MIFTIQDSLLRKLLRQFNSHRQTSAETEKDKPTVASHVVQIGRVGGRPLLSILNYETDWLIAGQWSARVYLAMRGPSALFFGGSMPQSKWLVYRCIRSG